jgi:hypothetical protein
VAFGDMQAIFERFQVGKFPSDKGFSQMEEPNHLGYIEHSTRLIVAKIEEQECFEAVGTEEREPSLAGDSDFTVLSDFDDDETSDGYVQLQQPEFHETCTTSLRLIANDDDDDDADETSDGYVQLQQPEFHETCTTFLRLIAIGSYMYDESKKKLSESLKLAQQTADKQRDELRVLRHMVSQLNAALREFCGNADVETWEQPTETCEEFEYMADVRDLRDHLTQTLALIGSQKQQLVSLGQTFVAQNALLRELMQTVASDRRIAKHESFCKRSPGVIEML